MTDKDIVHKIADIMKTNVLGPYKRKEYKDVYHICIRGNKAIQWMMTLYSLMGDRRKTKIEEIINYWKENHTGNRYGRPKST